MFFLQKTVTYSSGYPMRKKISVAIWMALLCSCPFHSSLAKDYFDPALLNLISGDAGKLNLEQYENAGSIPEGSYLVDIYVNNMLIDTRELNFKKVASGKTLPLLTLKDLDSLGINTQTPGFKNVSDDENIGDIERYIPSSSSHMDVANLKLELSVPQIAMKMNTEGFVDPALWDEGITAFMLNYLVNGSTSHIDTGGKNGTDSQSYFMNFHSGINYGSWRLRSDSTYNNFKSSGSASQKNFQFLNTYLQRDMRSINGELSIGEVSSGGDIFDSIPFRGIQVVSENDMLPYSQRGFSPVVTGIAKSNAQITVTQNGYVIYQTYVAPGPFRITDISGNASGDLQVTVTEADGSKHYSTQAYSSLPIMQRPGSLEYEVIFGQYRNAVVTQDAQKPYFGMASLVYGLPHYITAYGGLLASNQYQSAVLGTGLSLGKLGAISFDTTMSKAYIEAQQRTNFGQSYRLKYSKSMMTTGTTIDISSYRYSTRDYYSFADANGYGHPLNPEQQPWALSRRKSSWQTQLHQDVGNLGQVYLSFKRDDYWGLNSVNKTLSLGYNTTIKGVSLGVSYNIDRTNGGDNSWPENRQLSFNVMVPLRIFDVNESFATYNTQTDNHGRVMQQAGISGGLDDGHLAYGVSQGWGNQDQDYSGAVNATYQAKAGTVNFGYNYTQISHSLNYGASGGVLIHPYGLTFSQTLGDSVALVRAPGIKDARITGGQQITTDSRGFAVVPYLSNYQKNSIGLDPSTFPSGADVNKTNINVYPTKGAVVIADYDTRIGQQVLINLKYQNSPVPFGAVASLTGKTTSTGIVGDNGQVYLNGLPADGHLLVKWGKATNMQCQVSFRLGEALVPDNNKTFTPLKQINEICQ